MAGGWELLAGAHPWLKISVIRLTLWFQRWRLCPLTAGSVGWGTNSLQRLMAGKNNQMIIWIRDLREKRVQDVLRHENLLAHRLHSRSLERTAYKGVCERKRKYDIAMKSKKKGNIVGPSEHEGKWPTEDASWRNPWSKLSSKVWLQYKTKILSSDLSRE